MADLSEYRDAFLALEDIAKDLDFDYDVHRLDWMYEMGTESIHCPGCELCVRGYAQRFITGVKLA